MKYCRLISFRLTKKLVIQLATTIGWISMLNLHASNAKKVTITSQSNVVRKYQEGIDISHHQGVIDWIQLTPDSSNKSFIIVKATEGKTYQDPDFVQNFKDICRLGFQPGAYHFLRFAPNSTNDQMKNFMSQIQAAEKSIDPTTLANYDPIIALDVEEHKGADYSLVSSIVEDSVRYLKELNITPFIYTTQYFWNKYVKTTPDIVKASPLWIARYRSTPPLLNDLPNGWKEWKIWQYSKTGSVAGIKGNVDLNKMQLNSP